MTDDTQTISFPLETEVKAQTQVSITARVAIELAEDDAIRVVVKHGRQELVGRIVGLRLRYTWHGDTDQWAFTPYESKVTVQRQTLGGWGKPISRVARDFPEISDFISKNMPRERPEVSWHG